MGAFFIGGQVFEYAELVQGGPHALVRRLRLGVLPDHRLPRPARTGGLIAFLLVLGPHLRGQAVHPRAGDHRHRRVLLLALRRRRLDRPVRDHLPDQVTEPADRPPTGAHQSARHLRVPAPRRASPRCRVSAVAMWRRSWCVVCLGVRPAAYTAFAAHRRRPRARHPVESIEEGEKLVPAQLRQLPRPERQGSSDAPSLVGVGAAAVDFQVGTGRMPRQQPGAQIRAKPVEYTDGGDRRSWPRTSPRWARARRSPTKEQYDSADADDRPGRRAVPHQLRAVPQLRRRGRRAARTASTRRR